MNSFFLGHSFFIIGFEIASEGRFVPSTGIRLHHHLSQKGNTLHSLTIPAGSVTNKCPSSPSIPQIKAQTPKGRRPPLCVYLQKSQKIKADSTFAVVYQHNSLYILQKESRRTKIGNFELLREPNYVIEFNESYNIYQLSGIGA